MEYRVLGPVEVVDSDGRSLPVGGLQQRALLALLLTRANQVVSTDRIVDRLWGGEPPRSALNAVQQHVSALRKTLGRDRIVTRAPGYAFRVGPGELDLERFEALLADGGRSALHAALALWRGPALADLAFATFAAEEAARLEEMRLAALERRIELDLECGEDASLVGELEALVAAHPYRERLRRHLMLALYRAGRQADALSAFHDARQRLVGELGIDPSPALRELERLILRHDEALGLHATAERSAGSGDRSVVAILTSPSEASLIELASLLSRSSPPRQLILVQPVERDQLGDTSRSLHELCQRLGAAGISARGASFTPLDPAADTVRIASDHDADIVLAPSPAEFLVDGKPAGVVGSILATAACDVGLLVDKPAEPVGSDRPVLVPFGGAEHDWAAIELAAWIGRASGSSIRLLGREADLAGGARDASRLLASASLLVQRFVRVPTEPRLIAPGHRNIVDAARDGGLLVMGLSDRWRQEGLGPTRLRVVRDVSIPTLVVRKGLRPGGLAPTATFTRFTWSIAGSVPLKA